MVIAAQRENVELKGLMLVPNAEVMMLRGGERRASKRRGDLNLSEIPDCKTNGKPLKGVEFPWRLSEKQPRQLELSVGAGLVNSAGANKTSTATRLKDAWAHPSVTFLTLMNKERCDHLF